jgi:nucleotide-binding universal stress UspA family protein
MPSPILVPYDGSLQAHCAVVEAAARTAREGSAAALLAVAPEPAPLIVLPGALRAEARYDIQRRYEGLLALARYEFPPEVAVETVVATGDPAHRILAAIEEGDFGLVIMGVRSRGRFHATTEGSVASEVRRLSPIPVILTPAIPWRERRVMVSQTRSVRLARQRRRRAIVNPVQAAPS